MGLDMKPMGKPKPGFEKRYIEIFNILESDNIPEPSAFQKLMGKKKPTKDELLKEWFENQIATYVTLKAPRVGFDKEANNWLKEKQIEIKNTKPFEEFVEENKGFYVLGLAPEKDGIPVYMALGQDENVFRGQFLYDCEDLIGKELVGEAWQTKLAPETLDYGKRLMYKANEIAIKHNLTKLKEQRMPPENNPDDIESKIHIMYSLAKWLIFYGQNGHGYQADY